MPPQQLTLIRHAQGFHNLNIEGHQSGDPGLTLAGQQRCRELAWKIENMYSIDWIVASPLRQTLHIALVAFEELLQFKPDLRIIALPEFQETSDLPCDIGLPVAELEKEFRERKAYFILNTVDYGPTHIQLGQIITEFDEPYRPLCPPLNTPASPLPKVHQGLLRAPYTIQHSKQISGAIGVQAQLLAMLGSPLGADAEVKRERGDIFEWAFDRLETEFIEPTQKYVEDSVRLVPEVKNWLNKRKLTGAVYMVTGIKIARGVSYSRKKIRTVGLGGAVTADLTFVAGAPVALGPTGKFEKKDKVVESYASRADFVWAYRVQRVYIQWLNGRVKSKEKVGGDLAGVNDDYEQEAHIMNMNAEAGLEIGDISLQQDIGLDIVPSGFTEAQDDQSEIVGEDEEIMCPED
ncbi:hypothetical protein N0V95_000652 [Ascochyta clinopodiicola]|nr:hypothetical protein N0V95_000652 [Ascochyta clinopodiicola]